MKKGIFSIMCLFFGMTVFAQDISNDELYLQYETEVNRLAASENYLNYKKLNDEYRAKTNANNLFNEQLEFIEEQFKENLSETQFESVAEAMDLYKKQQEIQTIFFQDIKESSKLLSKLQEKYEAKLIFETYDLRNNPF